MEDVPGSAALTQMADASPSRSPQRVERRLLQSAVEELLQHTAVGISKTKRYRVSKGAVLTLSTKRDVARSCQSLTEANIDRADQLYIDGHSLAACSELTLSVRFCSCR